jgi:subtilisin family serine protease
MTRTNLPRCVPGLCACAWVPAIFLLSAAAPAHGQRSDYKPLPGKVVIVSKPGGPSAAELAVRLTEQQLLGGGALRKIGERAFLVDLAQVPVEQLSASPDVLAVYRAFELDNRVVAANRLLVKFLAPPSDAELQDFASDYNLIAAGRVTRMEEYVTFDVRDSTVDLAQRVRDIQGDARVARVKLDRLMHELTPMQLAPIQDPLAGMQWHLDKIKAQEAWETTLGDGVQVGMLDDAVLFDHPDLQANYTSHSSGPFGAADARPPAEFFSHGTSVMGLICAEANTIGVRGLAPLAQFSATAGIGWAPSSELMKAYGFALDQAVEVHNNSWGLIIPGLVEEDLKEAILNAAEEGRDGLGMVIVFAAGNSGLELQEDDDYNTFEEVISVGAVGETDIKTSYSNFGPTMDVMGPSGGDGLRGIVTTTIEGTLDDIYTPSFGGTSAASPIVAGVAALVVSVNPNLDREQVKNVLLRSAEQVSDADAQYDQTTGFSPNYAYGRVDAAAAVLAAQDSRDSNETWPGVPRDFEVQLVEGGGDEGLLADISWLPAGIPEDDGIRSDQTRVLILQRTGEAEEDIDWRPLDGIVFAYGDINQPDDGDEPAPQQGWVVLYHDFVIEEEEGRQRAPTLVVDGDDADAAQQFAIFAASTSDLFSFGVVINQAGEVVDRTPDDG